MRQKVSRQQKPKASRRIRKKRSKGDGSRMLIGLALTMILGGILAILKPIPFMSTGGTGRYGNNPVTSVYSTNETIGFGVLFIAIGLFLIRIALEIRKPE
jgi:hypothetical protein